MKGERAHHLAKHCLSGEIDLQLHFGTADPKEIGKEVARLGQKQLQVRTRIRWIGYCSVGESAAVGGIRAFPLVAGEIQRDIFCQDI